MTNKTPASGPMKNEAKKSDITRFKIMKAAIQVFSEHPYHAASMRMIGKLGGFEHPLIHYYFPTKADLFEAVVVELCEEYYAANLSWFDGLESLPPAEGLSIYLDRFLDYNLSHPEPLRIIALNAAQIDRLAEIPGYQHIPRLLSRIRATFQENANLRAPEKDIEMFINSFNSLSIFYLGSAACQAEVLGMDPNCPDYKTWVKNTMTFVFLPLLTKLIFPG